MGVVVWGTLTSIVRPNLYVNRLNWASRTPESDDAAPRHRVRNSSDWHKKSL